MISDRERYMAVLDTQPLLQSDAVVVLCGEDGLARAEVGAAIMLQEGAEVLVLSGGRSEPKAGILGAEDLVGAVMGKGVAPAKVLTETESMNTLEQADEIAALSVKEGWRRVLVVASPYHAYRAFLTFLGALQRLHIEHDVQIIMLGASHTPWFTPPPSGTVDRIELLEQEFDKISEYAADLATVGDGLAYLEHWEGS